MWSILLISHYQAPRDSTAALRSVFRGRGKRRGRDRYDRQYCSRIVAGKSNSVVSRGVLISSSIFQCSYRGPEP